MNVDRIPHKNKKFTEACKIWTQKNGIVNTGGRTACGKDTAMKKRSTKIIIVLIIIAALVLFDLYLRFNSGIIPDYYEMILISTGIPLVIISVVVWYLDEKNLRTRREDPVDYATVRGFRVKERYCTMGEENLAILTLYNQSRRTATVTVKVTFLNVAGKVLGTETQTVHGMVRGMEKHLCFRPGRDFHAFSYTVESSFYRGVCHERAYRADYFRVTTPLPLTSPHQGGCPLELEIHEEYTGTGAVEVACTYLLLDKENSVRGLSQVAPRILSAPFDSHTVTAASFDIPTEGNIPLGEELEAVGLTGVCVYSVRVTES